MNIMKASIAPVNLGFCEIEGLLLDDGSYEVAIPQLIIVFPDFKTSTNTIARDIKRLMGKDFKTSKRKTEFNTNYTNTISIGDLSRIALALFKKHSLPSAEALLEVALLETLERRFDQAFAIQRTEDERNERFAARMKGKIARRTLTDCIKAYIEANPELSTNYSKFVYSNVSDAINKHLFGHKAKKLQELLQVKITRDGLDTAQLKELDYVEESICREIEEGGLEPLEATKFVLNTYIVKPLPVPN